MLCSVSSTLLSKGQLVCDNFVQISIYLHFWLAPSVASLISQANRPSTKESPRLCAVQWYGWKSNIICMLVGLLCNEVANKASAQCLNSMSKMPVFQSTNSIVNRRLGMIVFIGLRKRELCLPATFTSWWYFLFIYFYNMDIPNYNHLFKIGMKYYNCRINNFCMKLHFYRMCSKMKKYAFKIINLLF